MSLIIEPTTKGITRLVDQWINEGKKIGFVPTMGALHLGHLSLINYCKKACDITICSIFVNPTQFDNKKDLEIYPRNIEKDIELLSKAKVDLLFNPSIKEMYPLGMREQNISIDFKGLHLVMEGKTRAQHFEGVIQIVHKLLSIIRPHQLYMGKKDYQQICIVRELISQHKFSSELIPCPIYREKDGLAMSSRNVHLSHTARKKAPTLYKTIQWVKKKLVTSSCQTQDILQRATKKITSIEDIDLVYLELRYVDTLDICYSYSPHQKLMLFIAANVSNIRLIDNIEI